MNLILNIEEKGYELEQVGDTMTVQELMDFLWTFDPDTKVYTSFDRGYSFGGITSSQIDIVDKGFYESDWDEQDWGKDKVYNPSAENEIIMMDSVSVGYDTDQVDETMTVEQLYSYLKYLYRPYVKIYSQVGDMVISSVTAEQFVSDEGDMF